MFGGASMPSLADIAAVTGNRNGSGLGDGTGWWVLAAMAMTVVLVPVAVL